ncbi:MAG: hypothetical protein ACREBG_08915 [Pyrinomonadaceae bacterium]
MYTTPMIFPLDSYGKIYVLEDENGKTVGTGRREVCAQLLDMLKTPIGSVSNGTEIVIRRRLNVRSAIAI